MIKSEGLVLTMSGREPRFSGEVSERSHKNMSHIKGKANLEHCVGMAANMIGVKKNIIVVAAGPFQFAMINPVITKKSGAYQTEEGCLSLEGVRPCTRYQEIEVDYLDQNFKKQHGKYSGWTAQIIQHEIDHCNGIVI